jgi:hypothetical protein
MKRKTLLLSAAAAAAAVLFMAMPARANERNELTYFTFSESVKLPGVVLPAGRYMFKHADAVLNPDVVQVFSHDGRTIYGTFLTIPENRLTAHDDATVTLEEARVGTPEAIKDWFYPGSRTGYEFVYHDHQAAKLPDASR